MHIKNNSKKQQYNGKPIGENICSKTVRWLTITYKFYKLIFKILRTKNVDKQEQKSKRQMREYNNQNVEKESTLTMNPKNTNKTSCHFKLFN